MDSKTHHNFIHQ